MTTTVAVPQDKVMLGITKAEFVKLPPVDQLVDLLPARFHQAFRICFEQS